MHRGQNMHPGGWPLSVWVVQVDDPSSVWVVGATSFSVCLSKHCTFSADPESLANTSSILSELSAMAVCMSAPSSSINLTPSLSISLLAFFSNFFTLSIRPLLCFNWSWLLETWSMQSLLCTIYPYIQPSSYISTVCIHNLSCRFHKCYIVTGRRFTSPFPPF